MKNLVYIILLSMFCFVNCTNKETTKEASVSDEVEESDSAIEYKIENDRELDCDAIALSLLNDEAFTKPFRKIRGVIFDKSSDGRLLLMTINNGGSMCSGTSYVLYKNECGNCIIKKVVYAKECDEGGVEFPAKYEKIQQQDNGYQLIGVFAFDASPTGTAYKDTMFLSDQYLESDKDIVK